ncbi:MAG TPA: chromosome partitioning protein ParA, partial [Alphaproteobacteria bacterium]
RLRQRQRLAELERGRAELDARHAEAAAAVEQAAERREQARAAYARAREDEAGARAAVRAADTVLERAREAHAEAAEALAEARSRHAALADARARLAADQSEAERAAAETVEALAALPGPEAGRAVLDEARARLAERRAEAETRLREHEGLVRAAEARAERLRAIAAESEAWGKRARSAAEQVAALEARTRALYERLAALQGEPARLAQQRHGLQDQIDAATAARAGAADALAAAEGRLAAADRALRDANEALARAREERVRAEGRRDQARSLAEMAAARIRERFDCDPARALALAEVDDAGALGEIEPLERQVERLHRERDNMGAVNLRADEEAAELGEQIDTMRTERDDLVSAIAKLRGGIASLNREGRQRLLAAFEEVNAHFQSLFQRLFGGGRAHLELSGDDDPLEAGLEVMASPPGKRLQALSLLSGGEKALAALALLFALFQTRPAPICVLDEVDAPLDDSNVDRFCTLLEDITTESRTRFLVVTHHRMTMARMHRLFGVTMGERGVSQLVSVDMDDAHQLQAAE